MSITQINAWAETIKKLHTKWAPHPSQQRVIDLFFFEDVTSVFLKCGRKWGKTEIGMYFLTRLGRMYPGTPNYYFAAQQNSAREILWKDPRIINFVPREWLLPGSRGINESEMVLRFTNGSTIKIDGSDNYDKYRGVRYKGAVYDEYKDHDARMRKAMRPNAVPLNGLDLFMGSPPEIFDGSDYKELEEEHSSGVDPRQRSLHEPSWRNPHISKEWLYDEKTRLYRRNQGDEWEREYGAKYVKGGASSIFTMVDKTMVRPHAEIMKELWRDRRKLQWAWCADPAGATCFGVLFMAINPYSKKVYVLDEIYETVQAEMTTKRIGDRIRKIRNELHDRVSDWRQIYDEAETWFNNEWIDNFEMEDGLEPSNKSKNDKVSGIGLIKDIMLENLMVISDRAVKFYWEVDNYQKDKNGKIPKKNDHLIDPARYIFGNLFYSLPEKKEAREEDNPDFRGASLQSDLDKIFGTNEYEEI